MRLIFSVLILFSFSVTNAQETDELKVKNTINAFFEGFHKQDSVALRETVSTAIRMQTIGKNKEGGDSVRTVSFDNFVRSIVQIPDSVHFEERLMAYSIQVDGSMAHAWTPYEFWVNDSFSHCGVNSFQLFKEGETWKILSIMDTRRKEDCKTKFPGKRD
ncbi:nuclear transport factor 2 family protein [uncultured Muriicola sp.]|uniref:nuclear transport factor 2 family protein n=1 Tax=uncultured Muriicola sp. TaxID=1583102 RepID=UPI002629283C|nr:nuclear transport factor 2 family protein [uncultured Muriicola sp.]